MLFFSFFNFLRLLSNYLDLKIKVISESVIPEMKNACAVFVHSNLSLHNSQFSFQTSITNPLGVGKLEKLIAFVPSFKLLLHISFVCDFCLTSNINSYKVVLGFKQKVFFNLHLTDVCFRKSTLFKSKNLSLPSFNVHLTLFRMVKVGIRIFKDVLGENNLRCLWTTN